jgi:hypothetical protein
MPFADANYPTPARQDGWIAAHIVNLTNGERLFVEERTTGLHLAVCCPDDDAPDLWVCRLSEDGVLAYAYSGDACIRLAGGSSK